MFSTTNTDGFDIIYYHTMIFDNKYLKYESIFAVVVVVVGKKIVFCIIYNNIVEEKTKVGYSKSLRQTTQLVIVDIKTDTHTQIAKHQSSANKHDRCRHLSLFVCH